MLGENVTNVVTDVDIPQMVNGVMSREWDQTLVGFSDWQKSQLDRVIESELGVRCLLRMWLLVQVSLQPGTYCNATWDGHYCWPPTPAGTKLTRRCSDAFSETQPEDSIHLEGNAYRVCQSNATWLWNLWTNYSECADSFEEYVKRTEEEKELVTIVQYILFSGSILSLVCLFLAISIFFCFKSLWCDRVTIHIHLMAALTLRYLLLYIIAEAFVFNRATNYRTVDWVCKTVLLAYLYATVTSVNWMFIQGIYLNGKLTTNVFDKAAPFKLYYTFGWLSPVPLLAVYAWVMEMHHPVKCWKGYSEMSEIWIVLGPIVIALVVNLVLLINILRVLLTKVHRSGSSSDTKQFQRAAKATLILSPILGINNLLFLVNPGGDYNKYYVLLNSIFGSTQGVFVALVYCYLSNDVRSAIRRGYHRFLARRQASRTMQRRRANSCSTSTGLIIEHPVNFYRERASSRTRSSQVSFSSMQNLHSRCQNERGSSSILRLPNRLSCCSSTTTTDGLGPRTFSTLPCNHSSTYIAGNSPDFEESIAGHLRESGPDDIIIPLRELV